MINKKLKIYNIKCPTCKKVRVVSYAQSWNIRVGNSTGRCNCCRLNLNTKGLALGRGWNKGMKRSGMSGKRQSDKQKAIIKEMRLSYKITDETRKKMSLAKKGKSSVVRGKTWRVSEEKLKNFGKCKGEKHWNWKGGVSNKNKSIRRLRTYKDWRLSIFKRDDYTCQECKKRGCYIEAHHIKQFSKYEDLRFSVSNGITLCLPCHSKTKGKENLFEDKYLKILQNV